MITSLIFRIVYVPYRAFSNVRYWLMRRFTRVGLAITGSALAAGLMGFDTENSVSFQAFCLLVLLVFAAVCFSSVFRGRFQASRVLPRFGTVGSAFKYTVRVQNLTARRQRDLTLIEGLADPRPDFKQWLAQRFDDERYLKPFRVRRRARTNPFKRALVREACLPPMLPHQGAEASLELMPMRRGVLRFAELTVARPDPLGLFRAFHRVKAQDTVLILPRRYYIPPLALPGHMKYQQGGVALAANVGSSDEFVSLRDYRRGDPPRHIHWRSWAKAGKPIVKEFEDEFFVRHALILDTFTDRPYSDQFEEAVSVAASFACTLLTQESLLDLLFVGPEAYTFTAGRGLAGPDQMLEILASVGPCSADNFSSLEHLVIDHSSSVSGCICVFLAWDEQRQRLVEKLKAMGVPAVVLVIREPDEEGDLSPGPMRDAPECLHSLQVGSIERQLRALS